MKITGFRTESFNYSRGRRIGDANGVAPSDRATASLSPASLACRLRKLATAQAFQQASANPHIASWRNAEPAPDEGQIRSLRT